MMAKKMSDDHEHESWRLAFKFRDQSPSFARGFALGQLYGKMRARNAPFSETIMADLREDVISLATFAGWNEQISDLDENWIAVDFTEEARA
jgi:hypothetical protein